MGAPSLRNICLSTVCDSNDALCLNLDNVLEVISFARMHSFPQLVEKGEKFAINAYAGLRATHGRKIIEAALGSELVNELERDANATQERLRRYRLTGSVVEGPAVEDSLSMHIAPWSGDATSQHRAGCARGAYPGAAAPPAAASGSCGAAEEEAGATMSELRAWLRENCVAFKETDTHDALRLLVEETKAEIEAEEAAMAELEQSTTARAPRTVVTTCGGGGRGRTMSVLDEARAGEEEARREMIEMAAAAARASAAAAWRSRPAAMRPTSEPAKVVAGVAVDAANDRRPAGGLPALRNMAR